MADNKKSVPAEKAGNKSKKSENFFVKVWKKLVKLCKDTVGELKKVSWTSKTEVIKSFKLVIATVVGVSLVIAAIDFGSSLIINTIANLIG
jgi:preprotein translocase SecE subunit